MRKVGNAVQRLVSYARRHGIRGTISRIKVSLMRFRTGNWFILFSSDLQNFKSCPIAFPSGQIEQKTAASDLHGHDLMQLINLWNPKIARRQLDERFQQGASLWLFKIDEKLAAYGWTLIGRTIEPYFFPLNSDTVHLFDFFVLPQFRGRRINVALMNHILTHMAREGRSRALIEAAEWNVSQLSSLKKSAFHPIGRGRRSSFTGKTEVVLNSQS